MIKILFVFAEKQIDIGWFRQSDYFKAESCPRKSSDIA